MNLFTFSLYPIGQYQELNGNHITKKSQNQSFLSNVFRNGYAIARHLTVPGCRDCQSSNAMCTMTFIEAVIDRAVVLKQRKRQY